MQNKDSSLPRISVVVPSLNQARFIRQTLESIQAQNYPNIEIIVIDGGSTDGTVELLKTCEMDIAYWESAPDRGQSHALNKGFTRATGDILAWQNTDDIYYPGAFDRVVEAFRQHPEKQIVFGDWATIDVEGRMLERHFAMDYRVRQLIFEGFSLNAQATFWRREVHERFRDFDERLDRTMDYDMLLRFGLTEGDRAFHRIDDLLAGFRRHPAQKTQEMNHAVIAEHRMIAERWNTGRFTPRGKLWRKLYRARRAYWYWRRNGVAYLVSKGWRSLRNV